jgi:hypothetical protein
MNTITRYEWLLESIDEHGDVDEVDGHDSREAALAAAKPADSVALVRHVFDTRDEGQIGRGYAYIDSAGSLPEYFDDGSKVPKRFHKFPARRFDAADA